MNEEYLLLETDEARYIATLERFFVPITGGVNVDVHLRRDPKSEQRQYGDDPRLAAKVL